ncbi:MAG TPA: fatty acyl-AMP ligase [Thermoanaerobaculia bacterium]|jgi:acyl-CoA synthetase (AMP-forming)/AMP-acid ligase II|nr:fatty acyl-AMP ligase [Thermoanaerobaculia bacterium]
MPETSEGILDWLEQAGRRPEGGLRFIDRAEKATWFGWAEVRARALAACGGLQALGVERGDRVALVFPTGIDFFTAFFGALLAGAVPVPLYPPARLGRTEEYLRRTARMLERSGARLVLAESRVCRKLGGAVEPALGCRALTDLPLGTARPVQAFPADLALIQFSSGTTVDPKPVALSHRAVAAQAEILASFWPDTTELRQSCVSWLPLYHDMGLIGCVFPALARDAGLTLFAPELFVARPALWLRTLSRYRATISPAPNFAYSLCLTRISDAEMEGVDLSGWQTALNGAESISPAVLRAFCNRFASWGFRPEAMTPVYGLSEAALAVTFSDLGQPFQVTRFDREELAREGRARASAEGREIVSVGRPVPGFRLRIVDSGGHDLPAGAVGRVWIQGPSLMEGYLGDPEGTERALRDGWLDTGDLGFLHDGELYLAGRAKDAVILRGRNHAPEEIERAVDEVSGLRAGSVVAVSWLPEDAPGEVLALFVEATREATPEELAALPDACREAVLGATGLAVDRLEVLTPGALPRTSSGKLRRGETLRLYLAGELALLEPAASLLMGALA